MKRFAFSVGVIALLASGAIADDRPNVVLIMCDDMGFSDIRSYGGEVDTPNLDKLAAGGLRFRQFYNNAKCEHTRASLITGHWWHHVGASASVVYKGQTFGERMRAAGYRTLMVGKWHAGQTPYQRGFDRYYGLTDGCCNFWNPGHAQPGEPEPAKKRVRRWAIDDQEFKPYTPPAEDKDFYTTDRFTDHAVEYLEQYKDEDKPFFLYVAYTAPHYPLHVSKEDVAKYRGKYGAIGWDKLREQRFERQKELGVHMPNTKLSPLDGPSWDTIKQADRDWWDLRMAAYTAMIDRMDRNIGRILAKLDETGKADNTVIFFLSDNGAEADSADRSSVKGSMPWEVTSYLTQGKPWANASNTPFRKYKTTNFEGGTHTPMIAYWPGKTKGGEWTNHVGHLIDFTPTLLDLAGVPAADVPDDLPGHSLVPVLKGQKIERPWPVFWQFGRAAAMRDRDWKIVRDGKDWALYNLADDPTELNDLGTADPERLKTMVAQWEAWWKDKGDVK